MTVRARPDPSASPAVDPPAHVVPAPPETSSPDDARASEASRRRPLVFGVAAFIVALTLLLVTAEDYGIVSDVPNYFESSRLQRAWAGEALQALGSGNVASALDRDGVLEHWRWNSHRIPHPPLTRELHGLTYALTGGVLGPLTGYRLATLGAFAALVAGLGGFLLRLHGQLLPAVAASVSLVSIPAVFAHAHFAATDVLLTAFWFGGVAFLELYRRERKRRWLVLTGLSVGAALATKFTGLLLGPVLLVWILLHRRAFSLRAVAAIGTLAILVFVAVNPVVWVDPVLGVSDHLRAGFARVDETRLTTYYFGKFYEYRPPWHYPFVWTLIVVPIPLLLAAATGIAAGRRSRLAQVSFLNLAVLFGALLLPSAPLHDGIRLFLPVFPFLALLAGLGVGALERALWSRWPSHVRLSRDFAASLLCVLVFAIPVLRTVQYHPHQLSYFNGLIGGVRGAEAAGLEISNMKEVLSPEVLDELAGILPADAVLDPGFLLEEFCFYRHLGRLPPDWQLEAGFPLSAGLVTLICAAERPITRAVRRPPAPPDFVFVLNRRGLQTPKERALVRFGGGPYYQVALQGVPLLQVYRTDE